ncbi:MAG: hypothetical protein HDS62_04755 [Bacteroidales bacterium]|nr:hypothetical protein [Bacteroidales bacterium]
MNKDIPELNSLLGGIEDPEILAGIAPDTSLIQEQSEVSPESMEDDGRLSWDSFMRHLDRPTTQDYKESRHVCKLDKELSDTLDELNIKSKSRSDLVNAIVRTFLDVHLDRMSEYRQERKSLFKKMKEELT